MLDASLKPRFEPNRRIGAIDIVYTLVMLAAAVFAYYHYRTYLWGPQIGMLFGSAIALSFLGWIWPATRWLVGVVAVFSLFTLYQYGLYAPGGAAVGRVKLHEIQEGHFFLRFFFASPAATMWMVVLFALAMPAYYFGLWRRSEFTQKVASGLVWSGVAMAFIGFFARWRESYLINFDYGHIPVSNLYEVFVVFSVFTSILYLYYERRYKTRALGGFVMTVVTAALAFLMWYQVSQEANTIEPLVPALKSWWMKIHVPANFIGYGSFAISAMVGVAYLIKEKMGGDGPNDRLPSLSVMDDIMYKSIALGFAFFTIATILGAMWAAEAWGGYWSWDPKETWALIVWLNYAAWLHLRLSKGWRGAAMAWWAVGGLLVTTFAFLGVNMFLSGLHSYGKL
ncbi:c-type cytochrome biogenesis protein CcsB [Halothiobacillus diazotrophicus]|uniref:C-type cytochrome biogenesis protein CcsB n=2 Tax=Halothiobacillus diazotrophicus TaxID=1860122 RepID=A0A191ZKI8_9GAMM|nr:c-type cytochrome biogenesis protein CcsB [Halothiobacillus diazotrophicus]